VSSEPRSFRAALPQLALLVLVFFFVFAARIVLSPLLPAIEADLGLSHARSASLFLFLAVGYGLLTLLSGLVSARIGHRWAMVAAVTGGSLCLLAVARSPSLGLIRAGLALIGMATGLYLPSAVPVATTLVRPGEEGRALAVHELAPNLAFVLIPLLAAALLPLLSWRGFLTVLGLAGLATAILFAFLGRSGRSRGEPPNPANVRLILSRPSFWVITALFALGVGSSVGTFSILPTYLVAERGLDSTLVNTLLGLSRVSGLGAVFLAGWLADRLGPRTVLAAVLTGAGLVTAVLGLGRGALLIAAIFTQPILTACFYPVGFATIARITPRRIYNVTVSMVLPLSYILGGGVVPAALGVAGDRGSFATGLVLFGAAVAASSLLVVLLHWETR
jgi:NNP family nitrate/nitrite transporter-like MFS transporter